MFLVLPICCWVLALLLSDTDGWLCGVCLRPERPSPEHNLMNGASFSQSWALFCFLLAVWTRRQGSSPLRDQDFSCQQSFCSAAPAVFFLSSVCLFSCLLLKKGNNKKNRHIFPSEVSSLRLWYNKEIHKHKENSGHWIRKKIFFNKINSILTVYYSSALLVVWWKPLFLHIGKKYGILLQFRWKRNLSG